MKKILDFIFENVEDEEIIEEKVIVDAPIVKHDFAIKTQVSTNEGSVNQAIIKEKTDDLVEKKQEEVKSESITRRPSFGIEIDIPKVIKKSKTKLADNTFKKEKQYESQPAMSPIFGILETHKDSRIIEENEYPAKISASKSQIGTVFSPIFGMMQADIDANEEMDKVENVSLIDEMNNVDIIEKASDEQNIELQLVYEEDIKIASNMFINDLDSTIDEIKDENIFNDSIESILDKPNDETFIANHDISLFDDEIGEQ